MHDVGMNMSQLAMSVKQVDDTIEHYPWLRGVCPALRRAV